MKYLILIHGNQLNWEGWTEEQKIAFGRAHFALSDRLLDSGELVHGEGLADPSLATSVSVRDGRTMTSDGPYPEAKEHLAGFYLVECSRDRAIEIAAEIPDALYGTVEVRPVLDHSGYEM